VVEKSLAGKSLVENAWWKNGEGQKIFLSVWTKTVTGWFGL